MTDLPNLPALGPDSVRPAGPARSARGSEGAGTTSPAFEVLLERLTARAAELEEKSKSLATPEELPEALDAARASLADAVQLGEELLEAFRAQQLAPEEGA